VGQGNARIGGYGHGGGDAGNHLEGDPRGSQNLRLFASPAEDEGVAPLQAGHHISLPRFRHEEAVDLFLGEGVVAPLLPRVDQPGVFPGVIQEFLADQMIVNNHPGPADGLGALHRDQPRIAGTGADDVNLSPLSHFLFPVNYAW